MSISCRRLMASVSVLALVVCLMGCRAKYDPVRVGILHSLTGTMAISERAVVDATLLAIEEINASGGLLGRQLVPIIADGESDWPVFAAEAERLITKEAVAVVFGCWTSASRRTVRPVFERHDHLLFYPVQYEGVEASRNIVYTGAAPNQQILPAVKWSFDNLGKRFFLVGSDYVFPRTANAIIRDQVASLGGEVVGEAYIDLGSHDVDGVIAAILEAKPAVILNTINGDSNVAFFKALRQSGVGPSDIPTMSFSISEQELQTMGVEGMVGDLACWNYFQTTAGEENAGFVARCQKRYGADRVTTDPMEAAYFGVYLWAEAVKSIGGFDARQVVGELPGQSYDAPGGLVHIDGRNNHCWKQVRIAKIKADGQFEEVWSSGRTVRPIPYPAYRSRKEWDRFLQDLYEGWGGNWAKPPDNTEGAGSTDE